MTSTRLLVLTIGPILMVTACFVIAAPSRPAQTESVESSENDSPRDSRPLADQCASVADDLRARLPEGWYVSIRTPFVISGDLAEAELDQFYEDTIVPTVRALRHQYFHSDLEYPVTLVLCSTDATFRRCNVILDRNERNEYSGLYSRHQRRVIVNVSTGEGTLAHELTHALAHADFPQMPEWFDEGLASLHEECEFTEDGLALVGLDNWRLQLACDAIQRGELRLLQDVTSTRFATRDRANLDYACVRSLCLYLQERGLLEKFFATCRTKIFEDPTGLRTLCQILNVNEPQAAEDLFRDWLLKQSTDRSLSGHRL